MRGFAIPAVVIMTLLLSASIISASICLDSSTLMENFSTNGSQVNLTFTCPHGCVNDRCSGTDAQVDLQTMWMIWAVGTVMLIISIVLGLPTGQITQGTGFLDMKAVVRYLFFFIGFMFVYFAFGTAAGIISTYGGSTGATAAADTATMVCLWTLVIFLFIFMVEMTFSAMEWLKTQKLEKKEKKWRGRQL